MVGKWLSLPCWKFFNLVSKKRNKILLWRALRESPSTSGGRFATLPPRIARAIWRMKVHINNYIGKLEFNGKCKSLQFNRIAAASFYSTWYNMCNLFTIYLCAVHTTLHISQQHITFQRHSSVGTSTNQNEAVGIVALQSPFLVCWFLFLVFYFSVLIKICKRYYFNKLL